MKKSVSGISILFLALTYVAAAQQPASTPITVDCSKGQSLKQTLAKLDHQAAYTVSVNGTCTEFVQVSGFHNLVLKGLPGATLVQPSTGGGNLLNFTLYIESSQSVQVEGFSVQGTAGNLPNIGIGHGSSDIRLRSLNIQGNGGASLFLRIVRSPSRMCTCRIRATPRSRSTTLPMCTSNIVCSRTRPVMGGM